MYYCLNFCSTPALGYFNDDDQLDFMVHLCYGEWPVYPFSLVRICKVNFIIFTDRWRFVCSHTHACPESSLAQEGSLDQENVISSVHLCVGQITSGQLHQYIRTFYVMLIIVVITSMTSRGLGLSSHLYTLNIFEVE